MKQFFSYATIILLAGSLFAACSKSNTTPAVPTISQTFTIAGISHTADTVISANGGAQIFVWNGNLYSYGMVFFSMV